MPEIHPKAINPFAPACSVQDELGVCGDAVLMRKGFLYRLIRFNAVPDRLAPSVEPVSAVKSRPESDIRHPKNDETALQASQVVGLPGPTPGQRSVALRLSQPDNRHVRPPRVRHFRAIK